MSATTIEAGLWDIHSYMMKKYGVDKANTEIYPLEWYIRTGRASGDFLRKVFDVKPYIIGDMLHSLWETESVNGTIKRIKEYIGYTEG